MVTLTDVTDVSGRVSLLSVSCLGTEKLRDKPGRALSISRTGRSIPGDRHPPAIWTGEIPTWLVN